MRNPADSQAEDDDEGPIYEPVKLTPYDRRRNELRELEAKRDAILAQDEITDKDRQRLVVLAPLIERAQQRFDREGERARDDTFRLRRGIDDWRADEGREEYNAKRRKVRLHPNYKLSVLTPDEKKEYERDRRSDANWFKRLRDKGVSEVEITAAYAIRLEEREKAREAQRAANAEEDAAEAELRNHPNFGIMGSAQ
ncbi:hypothetical protein [Szabonella alba]|uniref:Uncharacterized protein n=1 Tax=Szabonella alba TaxID=2804194 RepID=A0A8K0VBZ8_9RHOB|nr:hypothetical protein [Szabonella alba]MBL4917443.1 hypothetical protein [Szabonella alba]